MSCLRQTTFLFLFLFLFVVSASFSFSQGSSNLDHLQHSNGTGFVGEGEFRRVLEETSNTSTKLILAANRTHRIDPSNGFKYYTGGWNVLNQHYYLSVVYTAVPLLGIAATWFIVFGLYLCCSCLLRCCCFCCRKKKPGYSRTAYAISLSLLVLFTAAAIAGSAFLYAGNEKFQDSQVTSVDFFLQKANTLAQDLTNVFNYLVRARKIGEEGQTIFPTDLLAQMNETEKQVNDFSDRVRRVAGKRSEDIRNFIQPLETILMWVVGAMLLLAFLGTLCSILGLQCIVYIFVVIAWIAVVLTLILSAIFLVLHNVVADSCIAMDEWLQNPTADSALEDVIPRVSHDTAESILKGTRGVTFALVNATNTAIVQVYNANLPPEAGPLYSNQSGPLMPLLCNPFDSNLTYQQCPAGQVEFSNATEEWRKYICNVSASGICTTPGRITPNIYNQLTTSLNVSYGLSQYGPFLVGLIDSTYLKEIFSGISKDCCPSTRKSTKWMYTGFMVVSFAVMVSVTLWLVFARNRKHRKYTKKCMARPDGRKGNYTEMHEI